ncbi:RNA polymerase sigma factor [Luteolibacter sp. Populi]|uniref:RNA polymerase sigma factor n=1 Tax=Luteolibacter sp. Populi TaxID=3230487 RepID=UPI00346613DA
MEPSDHQLLIRYLAGSDEAAFRALVGRHLSLVHGVARRVTGNEDLARDVAQNTFIRLAERAAFVPPDLPLPVWLHRVARHLAIDLVRTEERRKKRELQSSTAMPDDPEPAWSALAPVVDQLINELPAAERSILLLRFYCDQSHTAIASQLGVSEAVSRKRASRAIDRLRTMLAKRGIATSSAALAALLPAHATAPMPATLANSVLKATRGIAPLTPAPLQAALLAMNATQKSAIAAAALIFLVSAGYSVVASNRQSAAPLPSDSAATSSGDVRSSAYVTARTRTERRIPANTKERLERLQQILDIENQARRERELIAFIDILSPDQFGDAAAYLGTLNKDQYTSVQEYHLFLSAWTKVDVRAALEHAEASNNMFHLGRVLQGWAEQDPDAALAWAEARPPGTTVNRSLANVLAGIAATDVRKAMDVVKAIPDERRRTETLLQLWSGMCEQPDAIDRLLPAVDDPAMRERLVERCMIVISRDQPQKAVRLLLEHPGAGGPKSVAEVFESWANDMPEAACAGLATLPPGRIREQAVLTVCKIAAIEDPAKAFATLEKYPETATAEGVAKLALEAIAINPPAMLTRIQGLADSTLREQTLLNALRTWRENDAAAAQAWMTGQSLPESVRQGLSNANPASQQ